MNVISITTTSISLSWSVPSDSEVISYEVMWRALSSDGDSNSTTETEDNDDDNDGSGTGMSGDEESGTSGNITDTSYTIENLMKSTSYIITVTVTSVAGSTDSHPIGITTGNT